MLIKRLAGTQSASRAAGETGAEAEEGKAPGGMPPGPNEPLTTGKGPMPTEFMPGSGTAPLPRNTVLQGRYDVEEVLGVGGMSIVYKARDLRFTAVARFCAIKEMPDTAPDARTGQLRLANFEREASLLATLSHPGIPKIYDFFYSHGRVYLVIEFIDGKDLESQLQQRGVPMPEEEVVKYAVQICDVLEYLHSHQPQPIVFRDLKPSNIIVSSEGKLTLIDFGIAKVFQSDKRGTMIGTEGYAPPEQYRGLAEPRGDLYGLGATMHHLLTNSDPRTQTPFTFHERPIRKFNSRVSDYIESVILRAVEYDMDRRWPHAPAMRQALIQSSVYETKPRRSMSGPLDDGGPTSSLINPSAVPSLANSLTSGDPRLQTSPNLLRGNPPATSGILSVPGQAGALIPPAVAPFLASQVSPEGAQMLWSFSTDDEVRSSPLCIREVVFVGSYDTNLYALNAKTGDFLWKAPTKAGICSSPALEGETVIVGSEDNYVYAFDARRGSQMWGYRTGGAVRSSPKVHSNMVFIGSDDQYIYALQADSGQVAWKYRTWNFVRSSAAFAKGLAFIGSSDGNLYALDILSGTLKWKLHTLGAVVSTPLVVGNHVIVGSMDNYVYAADVDTGYTAWRFECQRSVSASPAHAGERVIVASADGSVHAIDARSGRQIWSFDAGSQVTSSPRMSHATDAVYFGTGTNFVMSVDATTGELRWRYKTRGPVVSSPAIEDGIVYVGSLDRKLYALAV